MTNYDFSNFFSQLGRNIVSELRELMLRQKGVDGSSYASLDAKTVKQKGKRGSLTPEKRMIDTKDFWAKAFQSTSDGNSLTVFISKAMHGRKLRSMTKTLEKYRETGSKKFTKQSVKVSKVAEKTISFDKLAEYQNEPGQSLFFPQTVEQINNLQSVQKAVPQFKNEVIRQTREMYPELCKMKTVNI